MINVKSFVVIELGIGLAREFAPEFWVAEWIEQKEDPRGDGDVLGSGGVGAIASGLEVLTGIVVENDRAWRKLRAKFEKPTDDLLCYSKNFRR